MQLTLNRLTHITVFLVATLMTSVAVAEITYVSDELEITLRTGPGLKNKITAMLKSGDELDILQENGSGYIEVRTVNGKTGWVLKRFLMGSPSARSRLNEVQAREEKLTEQQLEIETLRTAATDSESAAITMQEVNRELKSELKRVNEIAADTLAINQKNKALASALKRAKSKQASLQVENRRLSNNTEQAWFLRGAGVILLGMFLGLLIPKLRFKKKRKWGDFSSN